MVYTKEELRLIWLDSFVNFEYKHKKALCDCLSGDVPIGDFLKNGKQDIIAAVGEEQ